MKNLILTLIFGASLLPLAAQAAPANRAQMTTEINTNLPSGTGAITANALRTTLIDFLSGVTAFIGDNPAAFLGPISLAGATSGVATINTQFAAGTPIITLPTSSGTFAVSASSPVVLNSTTGNITCPSCNTGSVTSVAPGTGLTSSPNPIIATGTMNLANTAVTPATYGDSTHVGQFTVDQQGRITGASNVALATGTVTSVICGTGLTGGTITTTGTCAVDKATTSNIWSGTSNKIVDAAGAHASLVPTTLSLITTSFNPDLSTGANFEATMVHATCTCTMGNPTNGYAGATIKITIIQSATGNDLMSWGPVYKFPSGTPPTLSTGANAIDVIVFYCRTTGFCAQQSFSKGLS